MPYFFQKNKNKTLIPIAAKVEISPMGVIL